MGAEASRLIEVYREDLDRVRNEVISNLQEGSPCPNGCEGAHMYFPPVDNCTCFRHAPCHRCIENEIQCPVCRTTLSEFKEELEDEAMTTRSQCWHEGRVSFHEDRRKFLMGGFDYWRCREREVQLNPPRITGIDHAAGPDQTAVWMCDLPASSPHLVDPPTPEQAADAAAEALWLKTEMRGGGFFPWNAAGYKPRVQRRRPREFRHEPISHALSVSCGSRDHLLGTISAWSSAE